MEQTKAGLREIMVEDFNKRMAGMWDLLTWVRGFDITLSVYYYYETHKRVKDGKIFISAYYYVPKIEEKDITDGVLKEYFLSVKGKVEIVDEGYADDPYYGEYERLILPAEFFFVWNDKEEKWKLDTWWFARKRDRKKFGGIF